VDASGGYPEQHGRLVHGHEAGRWRHSLLLAAWPPLSRQALDVSAVEKNGCPDATGLLEVFLGDELANPSTAQLQDFGRLGDREELLHGRIA
jgi:hypothetical protein